MRRLQGLASHLDGGAMPYRPHRRRRAWRAVRRAAWTLVLVLWAALFVIAFGSDERPADRFDRWSGVQQGGALR